MTIPDSVEILLYSVFAECDQLKSVTFGSSVTYIGTEAFFDCDSLEKLELPKNLSVIGARAVSQCRSLKELTIPGTLKTMNEIPFSHNESLTVVNIKDGLKVIEAQAFLSCPALESVTFPASVDTIYDGAFEGCTSLKDVYFCGDAPKHLESSAFGYDSKDKVTMHYNVGTSGTDSSSAWAAGGVHFTEANQSCRAFCLCGKQGQYRYDNRLLFIRRYCDHTRKNRGAPGNEDQLFDWMVQQ